MCSCKRFDTRARWLLPLHFSIYQWDFTLRSVGIWYNLLRFDRRDTSIMSQCVFKYLQTSISLFAQQWDLVCDRRWMASLALTIYMAGSLIADFLLGQLADRYITLLYQLCRHISNWICYMLYCSNYISFSYRFGRLKVLLPAGLLQLILATVCGFVNSFTAYVILRFLVALTTNISYIMGFVLSEWNSACSLLMSSTFSPWHSRQRWRCARITWGPSWAFSFHLRSPLAIQWWQPGLSSSTTGIFCRSSLACTQ